MEGVLRPKNGDDLEIMSQTSANLTAPGDYSESCTVTPLRVLQGDYSESLAGSFAH